MVSCKQIEANRRNARKSNGPRTQKGKARSSQNALKHGLTSQEILLPWEDPKEFAQFRQDLYQDLQPAGALEQHLADTIAASIWRLQRIVGIEAAVIAYEHYQGELDEILEAIDNLHETPDKAIEYSPPSSSREQILENLTAAGWPIQEKLKTTGPLLGLAFKRAEPTLRQLPRYEASTRKTLEMALRELKGRQAERTSGKTGRITGANELLSKVGSADVSGGAFD